MLEKNEVKKMDIRRGVFIPSILLVGGAGIVGILDNEMLTKASTKFFFWSLETFGWLYQTLVMLSLILTIYIIVSKYGNIRIGGKEAKAKLPFWTWFAMTLTGGVATGIVTWGVNEPIIYFGNVWGELTTLGITPKSSEAAIFALGRCFYNWTFIPYAVYALCGLMIAYMYYNRKKKLTVSTTLEPLFGEKITKGVCADVIDLLAMMGLTLGLTSGLAMCITLIISGLKSGYSIQDSISLFIVIGIVIILLISVQTYIGLDKGLKKIANLNAYFYYGLLALVLVTGPMLYIFRNSLSGLAVWFNNFWLWSLDPGDIGGSALTISWTMFDWAIWIAYAPVTAIFLGMISYGRTIKEYLIVNWVLPSIFGIIWFSIWGSTAIDMQISGTVDLIDAINKGGAVMALWQFIKHLPFGLGYIILPFNIFVILISFITAADAAVTTIASMCVKDVPIGTEPPGKLKVIWTCTIGTLAIIMAAFGGGAQGVDGVKSLASAGGFVVLFIFLLQLVSFLKIFFTKRTSREADECLEYTHANSEEDNEVENGAESDEEEELGMAEVEV